MLWIHETIFWRIPYVNYSLKTISNSQVRISAKFLWIRLSCSLKWRLAFVHLTSFKLDFQKKLQFFVLDAILNLFILGWFVYLIRLFQCKEHKRVSAVIAIASQVYEFSDEKNHVKNWPWKLKRTASYVIFFFAQRSFIRNITGQCKMQTTDCRLQITGFKTQTEA